MKRFLLLLVLVLLVGCTPKRSCKWIEDPMYFEIFYTNKETGKKSRWVTLDFPNTNRDLTYKFNTIDNENIVIPIADSEIVVH